ncbi:MAG: hypothetical protein Tsb008_11010 [Rhodothalassiaceae bacterium]
MPALRDMMRCDRRREGQQDHDEKGEGKTYIIGENGRKDAEPDIVAKSE